MMRRLLLFVSLASAWAGCHGSGPCAVCDVHATCDATAHPVACTCFAGFTGDGGTCTPSTCAPQALANGIITPPGQGATDQTVTYGCDPGYALNGQSTATCLPDGGWSGTPPVCLLADGGCIGTAFTDIVYRITGTFAISGTTFGAGDQSFSNLGANTLTPVFTGAGDTTPFSIPPPSGGTTFSHGFMRLRFANDALGRPDAGTVSLIEYYFPLEFHQTAGADITANVDHSIGLLDSGVANCGGGDTACAGVAPKVVRPCIAHGRGTLAGTTLTWDSCTPAPSGGNGWNFAQARNASGPGCGTGYIAWGNVTCNSGCGPVSAAGVGDSFQTWNQVFQPFAFTGSDLTTATFTMAATQIPNGTGQSTTQLSLAGAFVLGVQCGSTPAVDLTCDLQ